jgi:hypothetical protein
MPIERCTANAAGGTNQRLKLAFAVMCSFDKKSDIQLTPLELLFFSSHEAATSDFADKLRLTLCCYKM